MRSEHSGPAPLGYRVSAAAAMIGCKPRSIYRYLRDKRLAAKRVAGITLITAESLREFVENSPDWTS